MRNLPVSVGSSRSIGDARQVGSIFEWTLLQLGVLHLHQMLSLHLLGHALHLAAPVVVSVVVLPRA